MLYSGQQIAEMRGYDMGYPTPEEQHAEAVKLIAAHADQRQEAIERAFAAVRGMRADDLAFVLKCAKAGELDEWALGRRIADYRRELGLAYGCANARAE